MKKILVFLSALSLLLLSCDSKVDCPVCHGLGIANTFGAPQKCFVCQGEGKVTKKQADAASKVFNTKGQQNHNNGGFYNPNQYGGYDYRKSGNSNGSNQVMCNYCNGTGYCKNCKGQGIIQYKDPYSLEYKFMECPICHGTKRCDLCNGLGHH